MPIQFTNHAVERYIQFHMLANESHRTERAARQLLEEHAGEAYKLKDKTHRGDTVWRIDALGVDLVTKHENGWEVVVTVLPPLWFRGLTPQQAEVVAQRVENGTQAVKELDVLMENKAQRKETLDDLKYRRDMAESERQIQLWYCKAMRQQLQSKFYQELLRLYKLHPESFKEHP